MPSFLSNFSAIETALFQSIPLELPYFAAYPCCAVDIILLLGIFPICHHLQAAIIVIAAFACAFAL
jgi:hypothetical protein